MAKIGLNFGDKVQIADKAYRVINDGIDVNAVLGDLKFASFDGADAFYELVEQEDRTFKNVATGEVRGYVFGLKAGGQGGTSVFVTITDMPLADIEALDLKLFDPVELEDTVISYSAIDKDDIYKVFAGKIKKKVVSQQPKPKQEQHNEHK